MTDNTIPWPEPETNAALAAMLGVTARRIYKFRKLGGPEGRDLLAWHQWLRETGRIAIAERLGKILDPQKNAPVAPAGEPKTARDESLPENFAAKSPAEQEVYWRTRRSREQALTAEAARRKIDRELIDVADVRKFAATLAAGLLSSISDTIWRAMRPHLDGLALTHPDLVRVLRRQHDQGVITIRTNAAATMARNLRALAASDQDT